MLKSLSKKLYTALLIIVIILPIFFCNNIMATTYEENSINSNTTLSEISNSDEQIMMYDAKTHETTEVNMEDLRQSINSQKLNCSINYDRTSLEGCNSNKSNTINTLSTSATAEKVQNTSQFPYKATCRAEYSGSKL